MKKRNIIIAAIAIIVVVAVAFGIRNYSRNQRTYELQIPVPKDITQIVISKDTESVTITEAEEIKEIIDVIGGVKRHTTEESIQDIPTSTDNLISIDLYGTDDRIYTVFAYEKNDKLYFEQAYNGIYRISPDEFNSIEKYLRSSSNIASKHNLTAEEIEFDEWGLSMSVHFKTATEFDIVFTHSSKEATVNGTLTTSPEYEIKAVYNDEIISFDDYMRKVLGKTYADATPTWDTVLYTIPNDETFKIESVLNVSDENGGLPLGEYVLSKQVTLNTEDGNKIIKFYTTTFEIAEGDDTISIKE